MGDAENTWRRPFRYESFKILSLLAAEIIILLAYCSLNRPVLSALQERTIIAGGRFELQ